MGNCLFGGAGGDEKHVEELIQVMTSNGGIMELRSPVTVSLLLEEFPCHAVFNADDLFWQPLSNHEELRPGGSYLLLPLHMTKGDAAAFEFKVGHVRSKSIPTAVGGSAAAYRMSVDGRRGGGHVLRRSNTENHVMGKRGGGGGGGVWKVKLAIGTEQLAEILSQEARTGELIESVRKVAKCGNGGGGVEMGFSDQLSVGSSRASSKKD